MNRVKSIVLLVSAFFIIVFSPLSRSEEPNIGKADAAVVDDINLEYAEEMILAVVFEKKYLSEGYWVKVVEGEYYLPLGELFALLKFPIFVSPKEGKMNGWFIDPSKTIDMNLQEHQVRIADEIKAFDIKSIIVDEFDLYATVDLIETWFPLNLVINQATQSLSISSSEDLPLQKAKKRKEQQAALSSGGWVQFRSKLPKNIPDYKIVSWPTAAVRLESGYQNDGSPDLSYEIQLYGDLLGLNGQMSLKGEAGEGLDSAYLSLGRRDPTRSMFGPLKVAEVTVGDTGLSISSLVGGGISGRGIKLSNRPLSQRYDVNRADFEGALKDGYEAELYINSRLVDVFDSSGDGKYLFDEVLLAQGANAVKIVFYGPNGEREEIIDSVFVGQKANELGELMFDFALVEESKLVFDEALSELDEQSESIVLSSALRMSLGLGRGFSLETSVISKKENKETSIYSSLNKRVNSISYNAAMAMDKSKNTAYSFSAYSNASAYSRSVGVSYFSSGYAQQSDAESVEAVGVWNITSSLSKDYNFQGINSSSAWRVGTSMIGGEAIDQIGLTGGYDKRFSRLNMILNGSYSNDITTGIISSDGSVRFRSLSRSEKSKISSSFDLSYKAYPDFEVSEASIGASIRDVIDFDVSAKFSYRVADDESNISIGARKKYKNLNLILGAYYGEERIGVRVGLDFSLAKHPSYALPMVDEYSSASFPRVAVHAFEDRNANGSRDIGEPSVANIGVLYNGLPMNIRTDFFGNAVVDRLSQDYAQDLTVNPSTVDNPNLRPRDPLFAVVPRPGRLPTVQLPLVPTGDIEGVVTFSGGGVETSAQNVRVLIRSMVSGKEHEIFTEFDGLYYIAGLPVGEYEVMVDKEYLESVGLLSQPARLILKLTQGDSYRAGANFVLSRAN